MLDQHGCIFFVEQRSVTGDILPDMRSLLVEVVEHIAEFAIYKGLTQAKQADPPQKRELFQNLTEVIKRKITDFGLEAEICSVTLDASQVAAISYLKLKLGWQVSYP
jgi:hypothetical protein